MELKMTVAAAQALQNCGEGVIEYTCGVLEALGQDTLSFRLRGASNRWKAAVKARDAQAPKVEVTDLASVLEAASARAPEALEREVTEARTDLDEALDALEMLREQAIDFEARRAG